MKILVFGAHPDDIEPQMGGTINKYAKQGSVVKIVQFTSPTIAGDINIRKKEAKNSAKILGAQIQFLEYSTIEFGFNREILSKVDKIINDEKPDRVYTCWNGDSHQDHRVTFDLIMAASRKNNFDLILYEPIIPCGLTEKNFSPNLYVDISNEINAKINSVMQYESQISVFGENWIDAIVAKSKYNGFRINKDFGETFQIVKLIEK